MKTGSVQYFGHGQSPIEIILTRDSAHSFRNHNHVNTVTICLVLDGCLTLSRQGEPESYQEGECFLVFPFEPHALRANPLYSMISISIQTDFLDNHDRIETQTLLFKLLNPLLKQNTVSPIGEAALHNTMDQLYCAIKKETDINRDTQAYFVGLTKQNGDLDDISRSAYWSKYHFLRRFKKNVGIPPHQFQLQSRIRYAQHLLTDYRDLSVTEIAMASGFYDQSHFIKTFKKLVGTTPLQFREAQHTQENGD